MQFYFMADTNNGRGYRIKPKSEFVGRVRSGMKVCRATEKGFCDAIAKGVAWMPGVMHNGMSRDYWVSQQLVGLDFDNKNPDGSMASTPLVPADVIARLSDNGLCPMCGYNTYSATPEWPRFRVVLALAEPFGDPDVMENAIARLLNLFPEADRQCKDLSRLFFGTFGESNVWRYYENEGYKGNDIRDFLKLPAPETPSRRTIPRPRSYIEGSGDVDLRDIKARYDLLGLVQHDTGEVGRAQGNCVKFHHCPVCGHHDCFVYYKHTNTWTCFSDSNATGVAGGSPIDYVMAREGVAFKEALARLTQNR